MEKIKIVFILGTLHADGAQKQFVELVRRMDRRCFDLRVLAFQGQGGIRADLDALNIPCESLEFVGLKGKFRLESYRQLYRLLAAMVGYLRRERPQIVQSYLFWTNIYGCLASKIAGASVMVTSRYSMTDTQYLKPFYMRLQNLANRWTTAIIANAQAVKEDCLRYEKCVTPEMIRVIYNGVDLDRYAPKSPNPAIRAALEIPVNAPLVGVIGTLSPYKNHQNFLRAAAIALQQIPDARFLLIGRDEGLLAPLQALAETLRIRRAVMFAGERTDMPDIIASLDLVVSSSSIEGFSNAILEGMAMGKPVVATAVGGSPELVRDGETGFLVPSGDPARLAERMTQLLADAALRGQMGRAGRERVAARFAMPNLINETSRFYEELVR